MGSKSQIIERVSHFVRVYLDLAYSYYYSLFVRTVNIDNRKGRVLQGSEEPISFGKLDSRAERYKGYEERSLNLSIRLCEQKGKGSRISVLVGHGG